MASNYYINKYDVNQTLHNNCDFLNLCNGDGAKKSSEISPSVNKGIVDISYVKIDIESSISMINLALISICANYLSSLMKFGLIFLRPGSFSKLFIVCGCK